MKKKSFFIMVSLSICLCGCASLLNPYKDEFQCPEIYNGRCASMQSAYHDSVNNVDPKAASAISETCGEKDRLSSQPLLGSERGGTYERAKQIFKEKQFQKMAALIKEPAAPVLAPPEVVRVLIMSYTTSLHVWLGYRFGYFLATEPYFILSANRFDEGINE